MIEAIIQYWPVTVSALVTLFISWSLAKAISTSQALSKFPIANKQRTVLESKQRFRSDAKVVIEEAVEKYGKPFQIITDMGPNVILPPQYLDEVKNDPRLGFDELISEEFFPGYPGFEGFVEGASGHRYVADAIRIKLTQNLAKMTTGLSAEMGHVLDSKWTKSTEWHNLSLRQTILDIVSRLSVFVFLGPDLCRNQEWLDIQINHTITAVQAAKVLRQWPKITRPFVHWFLPECQRLRAEVRKAHRLLEPIIARRKALGDGAKEHNDALQWLDDIAKGRDYDALSAQLGLGFAATHTTSDLLGQVMIDLCQQPELIPALREEIGGVLREDGWEKTSLYKMRLLDSCLKETQRLKPPGIIAMRRLPLEDVKLKDGTVLPKGIPIGMAATPLRDDSFYENPDTYDGARFLKMRQQPGNENKGQFVSTSPEHFAFGHGMHACPGRFFAANEVKIALAHILLDYDFALAQETAPKPISYGFEQLADPTVVIKVRRRANDVPL